MLEPKVIATNLFSQIGVEFEEAVNRLLKSGDNSFLLAEDFWNGEGDYEDVRFKIKRIEHTFSLLEIIDFMRAASQSWYFTSSWLKDGGHKFYHEVKDAFVQTIKDFVEEIQEDILNKRNVA